MHHYENGTTSIPAEVLPRVADAVGMPVIELLLGKAA